MRPDKDEEEEENVLHPTLYFNKNRLHLSVKVSLSTHVDRIIPRRSTSANVRPNIRLNSRIHFQIALYNV